MERRATEPVTAAPSHFDRYRGRILATASRSHPMLKHIAALTMLALLACATGCTQHLDQGQQRRAPATDIDRLLATARRQLPDYPDQAVLLGLAAHRLGPSPATDAALRWLRGRYPLQRTLRGHEGVVRGVQATAAGKLLLTYSDEDSTARLWSIASGAQLQVLRCHRSAYRSHFVIGIKEPAPDRRNGARA